MVCYIHQQAIEPLSNPYIMNKSIFYNPESLSETMFITAYTKRTQPMRSIKTPFVVMNRVAEGEVFTKSIKAAKTLYVAIINKGAEIPITDCPHCERQRNDQMLQTMYEGKYTEKIHQIPTFKIW